MNYRMLCVSAIWLLSTNRALAQGLPSDPCQNPSPHVLWSDPNQRFLQKSDGDYVHIQSTETVYLDMPSQELGGLYVEGNLVLTHCGAVDPWLNSAWILVTGTLQIGEPTAPLPLQVGITLVDETIQAPSQATSEPEVQEALNDRGLVVYGTGKLLLYGHDRGIPWTRLDQNTTGSYATNNQTVGALTLVDNVDQWQAGDQIVIASTDFDQEQAETWYLSTDGLNNTIDVGLESSMPTYLKFDHYGSTYTVANQTGWEISERAEVGLLSRSVIIEGERQASHGGWENHYGHVILMKDETNNVFPTAEISWIEFRSLGIEGKFGRYPLHIHELGDVGNGSDDPFVWVDNSSFHNCYNHFVSVHNTTNTRLLGNVGYDTLGHGFFLEDKAAQNIIIDGNLGLLVKPPNLCDNTPISCENPPPGTLVDEDNLEPAVFWFVSPNNWIENNVAAGSSDHGFWFDPVDMDVHTHKNDPTNTAYGQTSSFKGNVAHSNGQHGFYLDDFEVTVRVKTEWETNDPPTWEDLVTYKNRRYGVWHRTYGRAVLSNIVVADSRAGFYLASEGVQNAGIAHITLIGDGMAQGSPTLVIGETDNAGLGQYAYLEDTIDGYPDRDRPAWEADVLVQRSLPQRDPYFDDPQNKKHHYAWDTLAGVEAYDGFFDVDGARFANLLDRDLLISTIPNDYIKRPAAGITQVAYDSTFAEDPRNRVRLLDFDDSTVDHRIYFRLPAPSTANMIGNTIVYDEDNSLGEGSNYYFMPFTDFLKEPVESSVLVTNSASQYYAAPATHGTHDIDYAQVLFESMTVVNPNLKNVKVNIGIQNPTSTFQNIFEASSSTTTQKRWPWNIAMEQEYAITYPGFADTSWPPNFRIYLRFAENQGKSVFFAVPLKDAPLVNGGVLFNGLPIGVKYTDINLFFSSMADYAWLYDSNTKTILLKLTTFLNPNEPTHTMFWEGTESWCTIKTVP